MRMPFSVPVMAGLLIGVVGLQLAAAQKPVKAVKVATQNEAEVAEEEATTEEEAPAAEGEAPATEGEGAATEGDAPAEEVVEGEAPADEAGPSKQDVGYAIGVTIGTNMQPVKAFIDLESVFQGIQDVVSGSKLKLSKAQMAEAMQGFDKKMQAEGEKTARAMATKGKTEGAKYLASNKTKEGVKTTKSGLQYKVLKQGKGKTPKVTDTVTTHYKGTLLDGTEFDASPEGEPVSFPLNRVIPGWTEVLQLMKEGSKYQVVIPSELAYGERGSPGGIPPHSTLIFEIELISVDAPAAAPEE